MTTPMIGRAWRFVTPHGQSTDGGAPGLQLGASGRIGLVEGDAAIRQAILLLLSTMPGERVMRLDYGCELWRLVFSPNDDTTAGLAMHYVRQAIERWEPRVEIVGLDAAAGLDSPGSLEIRLDYRVRATRTTDQVTYRLALTDGAAG